MKLTLLYIIYDLCIIKSSESMLVDSNEVLDRTDEKIIDLIKGNARMRFQKIEEMNR